MRVYILITVAVIVFSGAYAARRWMDATPSSAPDAKSFACERLVCLSPGITETAFALGLGPRVVGVTRYCLYPPEATLLPTVGGFLDPNFEALTALRPQLALLTPYHNEYQAELTRLGIAWRVTPQDSLAEIRESFLDLGNLCGCQDRAISIVAALDEQIRAVRAAVAGTPRKQVLLVTGRDVRSGALDEIYAVGPGAYLSELLNIAGGENIAPGKAAEYPALSVEGILALNPEAIIELAGDDALVDIDVEAALAPWRRLPGLRAAERGQLHLLAGAHLTIPGPRAGETLLALARCLHPELDWESL